MREVATKSSSELRRMAPMPEVLNTAVITSSSNFMERFGMLIATGCAPLLFPSPTGRKYACTVMSLVPEGLKMRASVRKLLTVPAMERNTSFAKAFVAKRERAEISNRNRNRIGFPPRSGGMILSPGHPHACRHNMCRHKELTGVMQITKHSDRRAVRHAGIPRRPDEVSTVQPLERTRAERGSRTARQIR